MRVKDKIALVTSSTKGIGLASAKALAKNGALVYIAARNEELANEIIAEIENEGGNASLYISTQEKLKHTIL